MDDELEQLALSLKGQHMTLMEEARALQALSPRRRSIHGFTLTEIGRRIGRSRFWVRRRLILLELPTEIHQAVDEGIFTPQDLMVVSAVEKSKWNQLARRILKEKKLGKQVTYDDIHHRTTKQSASRINQMVKYLNNRGVAGLPIPLLNWCLGKIDDKQIYREINEVLDAN